MKVLLLSLFLSALALGGDGAGSSGGGFLNRGGDKLLGQAINEIVTDILVDWNRDGRYENCVNLLLSKKGIPPISYSKMTHIIGRNVRRLYSVERSRQIAPGVEVPLFMDFSTEDSGEKYIDVLKPFFVRHLGYNKLDRDQLDEVIRMLLHEAAHHFGVEDDTDAEIVANKILLIRGWTLPLEEGEVIPASCRR